MQKIKVIITDDHTLVREAWSFVLNNDPRFEVIAECGSGEEAVSAAEALRPDVVIMDINLPGMTGFEATEQISRMTGIKVLGVSAHTQPAYAQKMMQHGARGYVTKTASRTEMFTAIIEIHIGETYLCDAIRTIMSELAENKEERQGINSISKREMEVIELIKKGCSSKQIADTLAISTKTVEVHRYNILKKLNLKNAAALVNYMNKEHSLMSC